MRASRTSGSRSGRWKRSMVELLRHRRTKEPATDRFHLNYRATSRLYTAPPARPMSITYCNQEAYRSLGSSRRGHVSVLTPSIAPRGLAGGQSGENCRYDGDYEKAMGLQTQEHQRLVVWVVRKQQAEGQGVPDQGPRRALPPHQVHAT